MAQQRLGREHDEGLPEVAMHLAPQDVEVIRGSARIDDLPVCKLNLARVLEVRILREVIRIVVAHLQVALNPGRRMFRALAFVAVGQQNRDPALASPLSFTGRDKGIENHLSSVGKITKLSLPQHKGLGVLIAVSDLEAENSHFRQIRIADVHDGAILRECIDRDVGLLGVLVVNNHVPLAKGSSLAVLTTEPHGEPFPDQCSKCQCFCSCPVNAFTNLNSSVSFSIDLL
mmetsp:Transcript_2958/g.7736  ORF Transcript_2958/g.7736 Transcript_2958/m.7736 type:complete len:230 (-) Transcript_2958:1564-2253(-)